MAPTKIPPVKKDGETEEAYQARIKAEADAEIEAERARKAAANPPTASAPPVKIERTFQKERDEMHDLFKLKVGICRKNVSYKEGEQQLVSIEHVHLFHTIDSHGFAQKHCSPVAGHTHTVAIQSDEKGNITSMVCGPALKLHQRKVGKGFKTEYVPISFGEDNDGKEQKDEHTHTIEYMRSEKIKVMIHQ